MKASIRIQDRELTGKVVSIANQPEPAHWSASPNVRKYATLVRIDGEAAGLRPGMTAAVEILVDYRPDVLTVPVQAVVEQAGKFYCWVADSQNKPQKRPVILGLSNDKVIEVKDGVSESDDVLLSPRSVVPEAREEKPAEGPGGNVDRFGGPGAKGGGGPGDGKRQQRPEKKGDSPGPGGDGGPAGPGGSAPSGPGGGARGRGGDFTQLDRDGDGKVSREEAPAQFASFFDRLDSNKDGFIDQQEMAAARARRAASKPAVQEAGGGG
jgi:hypothetical protein